MVFKEVKYVALQAHNSPSNCIDSTAQATWTTQQLLARCARIDIGLYVANAIADGSLCGDSRLLREHDRQLALLEKTSTRNYREGGKGKGGKGKGKGKGSRKTSRRTLQESANTAVTMGDLKFDVEYSFKLEQSVYTAATNANADLGAGDSSSSGDGASSSSGGLSSMGAVF